MMYLPIITKKKHFGVNFIIWNSAKWINNEDLIKFTGLRIIWPLA